jgi:phosphoribosylamine---glycine ligase
MRVLVVGSGGREHALAWSLSRCREVTEVYAAPGNPGIGALGTCVPIPADAVVELAEFAESLRVDLTVVGPELALTLGIADEFARRKLVLFGPWRAAAELEGSKVFTKLFCQRHGIPTAAARVVTDRDGAVAAARDLGRPVVFKADGLAAGKGVLVCHSQDEVDEAIERFFVERAFGAAGERVLVEECLTGDEVSFMVVTDGTTILPLASARDYKRLEDGDNGPNTGGMGAVSPSPLPQEMAGQILREIIRPAIQGLAEEGRCYRGVLYAGVMVTALGPRLLEFNCRLGDPETQVVLPRLDGELFPLLLAAARGELAGHRLGWRREVAVGVVLASPGYPSGAEGGLPIQGVGNALGLPGVMVFHAGTALQDGRLVTAGGRVLTVVGRGGTVAEAASTAYGGVDRIDIPGMFYRRDIGEGLK